MVNGNHQQLVPVVVLMLLLFTINGDVLAQDDDSHVHWAMGAFFGTGWYQVDENRTEKGNPKAPYETQFDPVSAAFKKW